MGETEKRMIWRLVCLVRGLYTPAPMAALEQNYQLITKPQDILHIKQTFIMVF